LEQLGVDGTKKANDCKFTVKVPEITIFDLIQIIPCSETSINSIEGVKIWKI
jgi:hypothetical protein